MEAILYEGTAAAWCKGGCNKFRYIGCMRGLQPICAACTARLRLNPVKSYSSLIPPQKSQSNSKNRSKNQVTRILRFSLVYYRLQIFSLSWALLVFNLLWVKIALSSCRKTIVRLPRINPIVGLKSKVLASVAINPKTTSELLAELNVTAYYLGKVTRNLIEEGLLISRLESTSRRIRVYALSSQAGALDKTIGVSLKQLILEHLTAKPMTALELHRELPQYQLHWIGGKLWRMIALGELIGQGHGRKRVYALPSDTSRLKSRCILDPINTAILELLQNRPSIWGREIARSIGSPSKTVANRLDVLERLQLVKCIPQGRKKLYVCVQKT